MQKQKDHTPQNYLNGAPGIAAYAGVSRRLVTNWVRDGLPVKRLSSRHFLARIEDVDAFIEERSNEFAARNGLEVR